MKLNLSILAEDLKDFGFYRCLPHAKSAPQLRFAGVMKKEGVLESSIAYVTTAPELARIPQTRMTACPSIICIGEPPSSYLSSKYANVLWTEDEVSIAETLEAINECFAVYNDWMLALEQALSRNEPLKVLAELSLDLLGKPLWMYDCHYQTNFSCVDTDAYDLPDTYVFHEDNAPWPIWEINAWRDGGYIDIDETQKLREPYILPATDLFKYRSLAYNLFIEEKFAATVTLEEIGSSITERDFVLLKAFGDVLNQALKHTDLFNISATKNLVSELETLLQGEMVAETRLNAALASIGWSFDGPFVCAVVHSNSPLYSPVIIRAIAEKVYGSLPGVVFVIDDKDIVFVISGHLAQKSAMDVAKDMFEVMVSHKYQMTMGVSTPFAHLDNLYHYRVQAECAIEVGVRIRQRKSAGYKENETNCYYFDDYMLDFIVDRCCTRMLPETLCPSELMALIDYDRKNYSDYCLTLREYLNNNMQISETARHLFIHRNSLFMRLKKIDSIMQYDLNDPDCRLQLMLAFRILGPDLDVLQRNNASNT